MPDPVAAVGRGDAEAVGVAQRRARAVGRASVPSHTASAVLEGAPLTKSWASERVVAFATAGDQAPAAPSRSAPTPVAAGSTLHVYSPRLELPGTAHRTGHTRVGRLVQPSPPARTDWLHSTGGSRGALLRSNPRVRYGGVTHNPEPPGYPITATTAPRTYRRFRRLKESSIALPADSRVPHRNRYRSTSGLTTRPTTVSAVRGSRPVPLAADHCWPGL